MQLTRLVGISAVLAAMSIATVVSCGGGSSGGNPVDAAGVHDASGSGAIDAPGSGSGSNVSDLGKLCTGSGTGDPSACNTADSQCVTLQQTGPFFCTESCGTGPCVAGGTAGSANCFQNGSNQAPPPSGGDAICAAQMPNNGTGKPQCALAGVGSGTGNMAIDWSCGIRCGTAGSADLGTCPTGLTCTKNLCQ